VLIEQTFQGVKCKVL